MIVSFVTYTKDGEYYNLVFSHHLEDKYLKIRFKPNTGMVFSKEKVNLIEVKMRDAETVLLMLEQYGMTLITEGLR